MTHSLLPTESTSIRVAYVLVGHLPAVRSSHIGYIVNEDTGFHVAYVHLLHETPNEGNRYAVVYNDDHMFMHAPDCDAPVYESLEIMELDQLDGYVYTPKDKYKAGRVN